MKDGDPLEGRQMVDLAGADTVEVIALEDGRVWVNVNDKCALRVKSAGWLYLDTPDIKRKTEKLD